jgi:hypothetical protein
MGHRPKGCGGALRAQFISFLRRPARFARKTVQPRLRRDGNAPLLSPAATSPPEGEILAALIFEFLMRTKDEWQEDFPLRWKWCVSTKRGAFPSPARAVCLFFLRAAGAVLRFSPSQEAYILIARQGDTTPSGRRPVKPEPLRPPGAVKLRSQRLRQP